MFLKSKNFVLVKVFTLLTFFFSAVTIHSQNILISTGGTVNVAGGEVFLDAGGSLANDGNLNQSITLCSSVNGKSVYLDFTMFNTFFNTSSLSWKYGDSVCIYNGSSASAPKMATLLGNYGSPYNSGLNPTPVGLGTGSGLGAVTSPGVFSSTAINGCLTVNFFNVDPIQSPGWSANVGLYSPLGIPGCTVNLSASTNTICAGNTVTLNATGNIVAASINNNFNGGTVGTGWQGTSSATLTTNACGSTSLDGSTYLWMANASCPRTLTSNAMDVSNGGIVSFEYRQAGNNGAASPCESPDIGSGSTPESVFVQYSLNGGVNWTTLKVMYPHNIQSSFGSDNYNGIGYEVKIWNKIVVPIPAAAQTANTQFRWIMPICTSSSTDNWGLDNVVISTLKTTTITIKDITNNIIINTSTFSPISITQTPTATTVYQASITDGITTCTSNQTITINSGTPAITSFSYSNPYCANGANPTANLVTGFAIGGTFSSTPVGLSLSPTSGSVNLSVSNTGTYVVTYTSPTGSCSVASNNTATLIINQTPTVTANASNSVICLGSSTTLNGVGAAAYNWTNGVTNGTIFSPTATATYTVIGTSVSGCTNTAVQTISVNPIPTTTASVTGTISCSTPIISLNSILAGVTYTWTAPIGGSVSSANTQSASASGASGIYTLTIQNAAGCSYSTTTFVPQNTVSPSGLSAGANQTLTCSSASIALNGSVLTPSNAILNWGSSVCGSLTTLTTSACAAGIYTLTATNPNNGCTASSTVQVFPNAGSPTVAISTAALVIDCNSTSQSVTVTSVPSTDVTYNWNTAPSSLSSDGTVATFTNANTYICTVTNTLSNCSTPVQVVVTSNTTVPTITITPTQTLTCATPTAAITLTTTPSSGLTYTWSGILLSGQGTDLITVNQPGNYSVVVTNAVNGCTNTASSQVDVDANLPTASINITSTNSVITCSNQIVDLTVNVSPLATYNYTWSTASTATNISVTSANVYSVTVVNPSTGCSAVAFYTVTSNTISPTVQTTNTIIPCNTNTVNVISISTSAVTYSWTSTNGILLTNGTSTALVGSIGDYAVTVTDVNNGCISTTTASVSQTIINASFTENPLSGTAPLLVDFTNTSNNPLGTSYSWNFGDSNTANTTNANNTYTLIGNYIVTLTATDASSLCTATSTINIEVLENSYISVPNVFTPNGDNANDVFKIDTRGIKDLTCEIFNRWGLKIYTLIATKDSWDGLNQSAGTYFYILSAKGYDGKEYTQQGFISLFK